MRQQVLCSEADNTEKAERELNRKLMALGRNWVMTSVQGNVATTSSGSKLVLLTAMVSLTERNNIDELDDLGLAPEDVETIAALMSSYGYGRTVPTLVAYDFKMWTKIKGPLLRRVEKALERNGLRFERPRRSEKVAR